MKNSPKYNIDLSIYDNWQNAEPMPSAWFQLAPSEMQERYRIQGAQGLQQSAAIQYEMCLEMHDRLCTGDIIAIGILVIDNSSREPVIMDRIIFESDDANLKWVEGQIESIGERYNSVRFCLGPISSNGLSQNPVPKVGRPSLDPQIDEALEKLRAADPDFDDMPKSNKIEAMRDKIAELHPNKFPRNYRPGISTIRRYFRKKGM